ncbi:MAG: FHA domain-containing protein [Anaerolineae bacterium]|nr:FHA domain-containing protein [Anaerolineae bacterium]
MQRYTVRRLPIRPLLRFGLVLGGLLGLPFGCLLALLAAKTIALLHRVLEAWQGVEYSLLGQTVRLDLVNMLHLDGLLQTLQALDERLNLIVVLALLGVPLGVGLVVASLLGFAGWGYNLIARLTSGMELVLSPTGLSPVVPEIAGEAGRMPQSRAWLTPTRPDAAGRWYPVHDGVTSIGSAAGNAIVLPFAGVAEHHAEIRLEGDRYVLYDLGSVHGSYVNGRRTQVNLLKDGWRMRFGDEEFIFGQTE